MHLFMTSDRAPGGETAPRARRRKNGSRRKLLRLLGLPTEQRRHRHVGECSVSVPLYVVCSPAPDSSCTSNEKQNNKKITVIQIVCHFRLLYLNEGHSLSRDHCPPLLTIKRLFYGNDDFPDEIQMHGNTCNTVLSENCFWPQLYLSGYMYFLLLLQPAMSSATSFFLS